MHNIYSDLQKNCLVLKLDGFMDFDEGKITLEEVKKNADKLKPGFTVINDITNFKATDARTSEMIKSAQFYVFEKKPGKVIRIVGNVLSKVQFSRTQKEIHADYEAIEVKTFEEAIALL